MRWEGGRGRLVRCLISVARLLRLLQLLLRLKLKLLLRQVLRRKRVRCLVSHAFRQFALVLDDNDRVLIIGGSALLCALYIATLGEKVWLLVPDSVRHAFSIASSHSIDEAGLASAVGCHDLWLLSNHRHLVLFDLVRDLLTLFFWCLRYRWLAQLILALPVHEGLEEGEVERLVLDDLGDLLIIILLTVI